MFSIGDKQVGGDASCMVVFEAGPTHSGFESAKKLIELSADAGADAVKFQIIDPDRLVADKTLPFTYEILADRQTGRRESVTEPLYDILSRRVLTAAEFRSLKNIADSLGLVFFATVLFDEDIGLAVSLGFESIKIASADVNHFPFIRRAARSGISLQIDTGNATLGEIERAVDVIRQEGNENVIIHHCPSGYPARLDGINLNMIVTLRQMFFHPIGFSDHSPGWEMDIAALALGVKLVEKTITTDRTIPSIEHIMSLEPSEMRTFVQTVRDVERALGNRRRAMAETELEKRKSIRRSAFAKRAIAAGQLISDDDVEFRRPGFGITPDVFEEYFAKGKATRPIEVGEMLQPGDLTVG